MTPDLHSDRTILQIAQAAYLGTAIESFLVDRKASGLTALSVKFYRQNLQPFYTYCNDNGVKLVQDITPDLLRHYFVRLSENQKPGGVHGHYRAMRALFRWPNNEEIMPPTWRNPMLKIKPPKVNLEPLEPVSLEDVRALIATCEHGTFSGERDRAVFLFLLDTGARAREACNVKLDDVNLNTGEVVIRYGKGGKSRTVFLGRTTRRAMRGYLRLRARAGSPALFLSKTYQRLIYDGLRQLIERRAAKANLRKRPTPHSLRRAFALNMLRNKADISSLHKLTGHADIAMVR